MEQRQLEFQKNLKVNKRRQEGPEERSRAGIKWGRKNIGGSGSAGPDT